jgi:hypothetical protein
MLAHKSKRKEKIFRFTQLQLSSWVLEQYRTYYTPSFSYDTNIRKGKVHPRTGNKGPEEEKKYSSTISLTSALDGVGARGGAVG